ncbi:ribbon-helix-helix domain-containing protein [Salipiger sp. PrR003]|uniref:ribbon-helix-helix domain-containing protein n=1 Tax=Salipiger sp. PrR003 TaxID=2706776 RepID=UPI0013D9928F|nr:ribbon-helix-helix domain-containing protein [Salipiger sp. PrR003]NDV52834.1 hypothetical protein [Salipiger sp. PrR003]
MKLKTGTPPSRLGKKQIIAYVAPELAEAVERLEERDNISKQEVVARAINAVLHRHGREPILDLGHYRLVRRRKGKSKPRTSDKLPLCRRGRRGVGGWYDYSKVARVGEFAQDVDLSVQRIVEIGLEHVTGIRQIDV